jgi:hypothetical protein
MMSAACGALPLPHGPRRGRRRGGRGSRIGQLQRLHRIDEARAEIVVAVAGESRFALAVKMRRMSAGVSFGLRSSNSATMPLTSAAATDVPVVI